jgi:hypothetical protein
MGAAKSGLFALHRQYFDKKQIVFHAGNSIVQLNSTGESSPVVLPGFCTAIFFSQ